MSEKFTARLQKATSNDLYEISLQSSMAKEKEVYIFEKGEMADLFDRTRAEAIRANFLKNTIKVKQITNIPTLSKFTDSDEFANTVMT
ncbi:MAG: hypothetical protein Q8P56_05835, partial [Candidatus Uhrbacteria bacterium]|nr:hypothetical protein [Candidatus Uhrbacteria bacterium]